jgi:hypothetical protein
MGYTIRRIGLSWVGSAFVAMTLVGSSLAQQPSQTHKRLELKTLDKSFSIDPTRPLNLVLQHAGESDVISSEGSGRNGILQVYATALEYDQTVSSSMEWRKIKGFEPLDEADVVYVDNTLVINCHSRKGNRRVLLHLVVPPDVRLTVDVNGSPVPSPADPEGTVRAGRSSFPADTMLRGSELVTTPPGRGLSGAVMELARPKTPKQ